MSSNQKIDYAIEVNNVGKSYQMYEKPSDRLKQMLMLGRKQYYKEFWALRDISFQIKKGETVGIIGRNGSGKSTLLQIICGTLNPSAGRVKANGKVAALLELGAGFNPEFSGVENIYMATSLYGLSKDEVDRRFADIAAFADIGNHIYHPVKTYSSGMYVRLAFAVIAHVDADILVVDEALAVGDAVFTQKCMRYIRKFKENGTLLFVSHDMGSVLNLCERAVWLQAGEVRNIGEAKDIAEQYLQYTLQEVYGQEARLLDIKKSNAQPETKTSHARAEVAYASGIPKDKPAIDYQAQVRISNNLNEAKGWQTGAGEILNIEMSVIGKTENVREVLHGGEIVKFTIQAVAHEEMSNPILGFLVRDRLGQDLFGENTLAISSIKPMAVDPGQKIKAEFNFKLPMLPNGDYTVMVSLADGTLHKHVQHHWLHNALILHVASSKIRYGLVGIEFGNIEFTKI